MNIKKISIAVTLILVVIISGVVVFSMMGDDTESPEDDGPESFDYSENLLSDTPPGITEQNRNLEINETQLVNSHEDILESSSALISITENDVTYSIQKDENVYIERSHFDDLTEQYSTGEYTIIKTDENKYSSNNHSISSNEYTKESNFKSLFKYLEVDNFSETNDGNIEIILVHNEEDEHSQLSNTFGFESINYASITFTITMDGLIKDSYIEIIGKNNGVRDVHEESYNVTDVGEFTLNEPTWLSDAENTISIVDGLYNRLDGQMVIQHNGFTTVPEGHPIEITNLDTGETTTINLPEEFSEGDSLGLSFDGDEWTTAINEVPEEGTPIDSNRFRVVAENNQQHDYFNITLRA